MQKLTISSRAFHSDQFGPYARYITGVFGYDMILPMNTGAEAVETAVKLARKWAYKFKGVGADRAIVLACEGNFHGRTTGVISLSTDPEARENYGPFLPLVGAVCPSNDSLKIRFNSTDDLAAALERHGRETAAFIVEPIQGEAGVIVPDRGYLKKCHDLCRKHNVLFIADEIQSGLGRTGRMLACEHDGVKPDVVLLGKALSGGIYPVSAVLANKDVMLCIEPGTHGSTYGGNPVACAVAMAALEVMEKEHLCQKSTDLGEYFRSGLRALQKKAKCIKEVRGVGLMNAIEMDETEMPGGMTAYDVCLKMKEAGVLAKPTHRTVIRLTPPLCITEAQIDTCLAAISRALEP